MLSIVPAAGFHDARGAKQGQRHHNDRDESQLWADCKHHDQYAGSRDDLRNDRSKILADCLIDRIHIVGDHAEDVAMRMGIIVIQF